VAEQRATFSELYSLSGVPFPGKMEHLSLAGKQISCSDQ